MTLDTYLRNLHGRCPGCGHDVATQGCHCGGSDWAIFTAALRKVVGSDGLVHQKDVRPLIKGRIQPKRIGAQYTKAKALGVLVQVGKEPSSDSAGRNTHHDSPIYELRAARLAAQSARAAS